MNRANLNSSLSIASLGRDHSTVMHAVEKIQRDVKIDPKLRREINEIEGKL